MDHDPNNEIKLFKSNKPRFVNAQFPLHPNFRQFLHAINYDFSQLSRGTNNEYVASPGKVFCIVATYANQYLRILMPYYKLYYLNHK